MGNGSDHDSRSGRDVGGHVEQSKVSATTLECGDLRFLRPLSGPRNSFHQFAHSRASTIQSRRTDGPVITDLRAPRSKDSIKALEFPIQL